MPYQHYSQRKWGYFEALLNPTDMTCSFIVEVVGKLLIGRAAVVYEIHPEFLKYLDVTLSVMKRLRVEPLLLHMERSQLIWLGQLYRMPHGHLP